MNKIVGIDYGTKNVGLAISDENQTIAKRFDTVKVRKNRSLVKLVAKKLEGHEVGLIVMGMPLGLDGKPTKLSKQAKEFAGELSSQLGITVEEWNETYTSAEAEKTIANTDKIHMEAARIILQGYLDYLASGI